VTFHQHTKRVVFAGEHLVHGCPVGELHSRD
jgi:hypothetical protein